MATVRFTFDNDERPEGVFCELYSLTPACSITAHELDISKLEASFESWATLKSTIDINTDLDENTLE